MHRVVCAARRRPPAIVCTAAEMKTVCELMAECWSENGRSRHTALKVVDLGE
jgi:hypothetical protein